MNFRNDKSEKKCTENNKHIKHENIKKKTSNLKKEKEQKISKTTRNKLNIKKNPQARPPLHAAARRPTLGFSYLRFQGLDFEQNISKSFRRPLGTTC